MKHKQQVLGAEYKPNKAFKWRGPSVCRVLSTTFKEPTNLGLCAVELPDPPDGYQFCDTLEEADAAYGTEIAIMADGPIIRLMWFSVHHVLDHDLVFAYAKKAETREEYLKRTMPEGYEWVGRGTLEKLSAPEFTGRSISVDNTVKDWADTAEARYCGNRSSLYYIRKIEQPRPKFDPQAGSKWEHYQSEDTFVLERLHNRKFVLLDSNGFRWTAPMHCAKDAFGGREAEFTEVKAAQD